MSISVKKILYLIQYFFISIFLTIATTVYAEIDISQLKSPEEAFNAQVYHSSNGLMIEFNITPKYYLYKDKFTFKTEPEGILGTAIYGQTVNKEDKFFGKQEVLSQNTQINIPFKKDLLPTVPFTLHIEYQGCFEGGICYPPISTDFHITGSGLFKPEKSPSLKNDIFPLGNDSKIHSQEFSPSNKIGWASILTFFITGIALSLTACMYPLLPILSSIIVGNHHPSNKIKGFILSLAYTQGLALTYTAIGVITGLTGALLTLWLQQPVVILCAAFIMVILALGMFDLIHIQIPASIQQYFTQKNQKLSRGKVSSVFVMGMFSALIVGPCVAPPLAIALGYIGQTKDALLGGALLYMMALGMGIPLLIIGTFGSQILPRSGQWMNTIKYFFGVIILGLAIYLATPFLPIWLSITLYTSLIIFIFISLIKKIYTQKKLKFKLPLIGFAITCFIAGILFVTFSIKKIDTPIHSALRLHFQQHNMWQKFTDVNDVKAAIITAYQTYPDKPVLLDFYADWCISCKEMESKTFHSQVVQKIFLDQYQLIQIDITQSTKEHQDFLKEYGLFGPPAIFMLHKDQQKGHPLIGYAEEQEFIKWLEKERNRIN